MIRAVAFLLAVLALARPATADTLPPGVTPTDQAAIQAVIGQQFEAFKRDDAAAAYRYAAPNIQRIFPTAEQFIQMVRRAYPPVYRPRDAEFTALALRDGEVVQEVELVGPDQVPALAVYTMARGAGGEWLIAGCVLLPSSRVGT